MMSKYWQRKMLYYTFVTSGVPFYLGLSSTEPNVDGSGVTEPSASTGYRRVAVNSFVVPGSGAIAYNNSSVVFPKSTDVWFDGNNPATHWVLFDGPNNNAHALCWCELDGELEVARSTTISFASDTIKIVAINGEDTGPR